MKVTPHKITMKAWFLSLTVIEVLTFVTSTGLVYCPQGSFQPDPDGPCRPCSMCTGNQIVRETCWKNRDTVCGAFTDFQLFHNENTLKLTHKDTNLNQVKTHIPDDNIVKQEADNEKGTWHTITMAMIVVLVVTGVLFSAFITVVCYRCRMQNKDGIITQIDKDSDYERPSYDDFIAAARDREIRPSTSGSSQDVMKPACSSSDVMAPAHAHTSSIEQFEIAMDP